MKLILIRHGETDRNKDKHAPYSGPVELNETGKKQAALTAERLKDEHIDRLYSSDLRRAEQTADYIARFHPNTARFVDQNLRERNSGAYGKKTVAEREAAQQASGQSYRDWRPEGGESLRDVKIRAQKWFDQIRSECSDKTVAIVSHGFFLFSMLEVVIEAGADTEKEEYSMSNGGITILDIHPDGQTKIHHLNDTQHLGDMLTKSSGIGDALRRAKGSQSNFA